MSSHDAWTGGLGQDLGASAYRPTRDDSSSGMGVSPLARGASGLALPREVHGGETWQRTTAVSGAMDCGTAARGNFYQPFEIASKSPDSLSQLELTRVALDAVRARPLLALGAACGLGLGLALAGEPLFAGRKPRRPGLLLLGGLTAAVAAAAISALDDRLRTRWDSSQTGLAAGGRDADWLISPSEAAHFHELPADVAADRAVSLWERVAAESVPEHELSRVADLTTELVAAHPAALAPDVLRLFEIWPVLAHLSGVVGAQVAWTAGRAGLTHVLHALAPALGSANLARAADSFVQAVMSFPSGSPPPTSRGLQPPPSTVYPARPRDGDRGSPPPPPSAIGTPAPPEPVHLGAAAPHSVRPNSQFLANFAAYGASYRDQVTKKLLLEVDADDLRLDKREAWWKEGTRIVVIPSAPGLEFDPPRADFEWNGMYVIAEFKCTVIESAARGSTVLDFRVCLPMHDGTPIQVDSVRITIGIVENAPVKTRRTAGHPAPTTVFASYATEDRRLVSSMLSVLQALPIRVYEWRMKAVPGEWIRDTLEEAIRSSDLFYLFWSRHAKASDWVRWELSVALDGESRGRPHIIPQLLEPLAKEDFPSELHGRQFYSPFYFLDPPDTLPGPGSAT